MTPKNIAVTRQLPPAVMSRLSQIGTVRIPASNDEASPDELHELVYGAHALVTTLRDPVDEPLLDAAGTNLQIVANIATGFDNFDLDALAQRGVIATNTPDVLTDATADLTMGLILAATRRIAEGDRMIRARTPWAWSIDFMLGSGLQGKRLGLIGLGAIARAVAARATAFGLEVVHLQHRPHLTDRHSRPVDLDELLTTSDLISLHCPLTSATHHLIDARALKAMKPSAYLINTARGPIVDELALAEALGSGAIAGAALDVFEREPLVEERLLKLDNVVLVPHLGSATVETRTAMGRLAADNVGAVLAGRPPLTPIAVS